MHPLDRRYSLRWECSFTQKTSCHSAARPSRAEVRKRTIFWRLSLCVTRYLPSFDIAILDLLQPTFAVCLYFKHSHLNFLLSLPTNLFFLFASTIYALQAESGVLSFNHAQLRVSDLVALISCSPADVFTELHCFDSSLNEKGEWT